MYKKQGPSPIFLVRATRIFSKAKTLKQILICHCPSNRARQDLAYEFPDRTGPDTQICQTGPAGPG